MVSKLWGVCYSAELQRPLPLNLREFIIFIFRELNLALESRKVLGKIVVGLRARPQFRDVTKPLGQAAVGALTIGILRTARYFDPTKTANLFGRIARSIGPMMREQKIGRANLTAAFPEKSAAEIEAILAGVWNNLGRLGAEFAHLDHVWEHDPARPGEGRIEIPPRTHELFAQLRLDGKP